MLNFIKNLIGEKAGVRIIVRVVFTPESKLAFQSTARALGLLGVARVTTSYAQLDFEGPKSKIQQAIVRLQGTRISTQPVVLEVTWLPYEGKYENFRVAS